MSRNVVLRGHSVRKNLTEHRRGALVVDILATPHRAHRLPLVAVHDAQRRAESKVDHGEREDSTERVEHRDTRHRAHLREPRASAPRRGLARLCAGV